MSFPKWHHGCLARWAAARKGIQWPNCHRSDRLLQAKLEQHLGLLLQGAVNVSFVQGELTPERAVAMSSRGRGIDPKGGQSYAATALSLVFHPAHPLVPTLRADVRLFQVRTPAKPHLCLSKLICCSCQQTTYCDL